MAECQLLQVLTDTLLSGVSPLPHLVLCKALLLQGQFDQVVKLFER